MIGSLCCFGGGGGLREGAGSLLVYKIENRFLRLGVLFGYLSG